MNYFIASGLAYWLLNSIACNGSYRSHSASKLSLHNLYYVPLKTGGVTLGAGVAQLG